MKFVPMLLRSSMDNLDDVEGEDDVNVEDAMLVEDTEKNTDNLLEERDEVGCGNCLRELLGEETR